MSDTPFGQDGPNAGAGRAPRRALAALVLLGACLVALGWQGGTGLSPALVSAAGAALAGTALVAWLLPAWTAARQRSEEWHAQRLLETDFLPSLLTDDDGIVRRTSALARDLLGVAPGQALAQLFSDRLAAPAATLRRLHEAALPGRVAQDILPGEPPLRVAVCRMGRAGYLWRFEPGGARGAAGLPAALPLAEIGPDGTVTAASEALATLLGRQPATLDEVLADPPLRPGTLHLLRGADGVLPMRVASVPAARGSVLMFFPPAEEDGASPDLDALPVPILRLAPDGAVLGSNRLACGLLGEATLTDRRLGDLVEGLGRPVEDWLLDIAEGRGPGRPEVVRASLPAEETYLQVTVRPVPNGAERTLLAVLSDATELKTLEAQFVQSQKMQAIGQLAGGVAHDFNNLLTAIGGHCDLLLLRHDPGDPDYADLMQINQNANRAASLVGQLLAFSRKQTLQLEPLDLRETLAELAHLLNRLVGERIRLTLSHDPDLRPIRGDRRQLEQVLMNLVVNARDAMPEGGEITIETRVRQLLTPLERDRVRVPPGDYVVVSVSDQGRGIPADKLPKIFEPFFTTKRPGEGTGLGLSTAYGIVKQSGGYIFADSVVGTGTCFSLYFPAHRPTAAVAPPPAPPATERGTGGTGTVLLVEDEAPVRAFAARALRLCGHKVIEAENAEEALATLEDPALRIDVFVTDVVMPGRDGPSWVREALRARPNARVIFVSGYSEESLAKDRARVPNSVFLPKPFSLAQLTDTVQDQLAG